MIITSENYFSTEAQKKYMGVSQFKAFEECPAAVLAELNGEFEREPSTSMLVGSYVDAHFEGTLDLFKAKHPQLFKKDGGLKSEYIQAELIINRIESDEMFMEYMSGEKQVIYTGEIEGVPVKIKVDSMHSDKMVDLKIMKDFEPVYLPEQGRVAWFEAWKYDLQGAVYQEIVRQNTGEKLPFFLAAATKEKVTDIGIYQIEQDLLDFELAKFKEKVQLFDAIKQGIIPAERCDKCNYCKATKVLTEVIKSGDLLNE